MFARICLIAVIVLSLVSVSIVFAEPNMQEGKWEMTMKMDMKGMPVAMPPVKVTHCMTKKDMVPQKPEKNQECKNIKTNISGDTVTWIMECKDKQATVESNGKITYKGNSFDGVINMTMTDKRKNKSQMTQKISGKRIGDCK